MSLNHKAFVFDYHLFQRELRPMLEAALASGAVAPLRQFMKENLPYLKDPDEGTPLEEGWEQRLETRDVDQYGDIALTKYYSPDLDGGIGSAWAELDVCLAAMNLASSTLGATIGNGQGRFDPGKIGSYFQSPDDVHRNLKALREASAEMPAELLPSLSSFITLLQNAMEKRAGLYVTF
jgi:hypothetical protein